MFGVSAASMGPWLERNGPKKALILSSSLFLIGNLLSSLAIYLKAIWLLYLGYGVIGGFGLGLGYISPVSPLQKWSVAFNSENILGTVLLTCYR